MRLFVVRVKGTTYTNDSFMVFLYSNPPFVLAKRAIKFCFPISHCLAVVGHGRAGVVREYNGCNGVLCFWSSLVPGLSVCVRRAPGILFEETVRVYREPVESRLHRPTIYSPC